MAEALNTLDMNGTIVVGEKVGISSVAISQGSLVVRIKETEEVSQPTAPFSNTGTTERVPDTTIGVQETQGYLIPVSRSVTVSDLAKSLNAIGATLVWWVSGITWQINPGHVALISGGQMKLDLLEQRLEILVAFRRLIPEELEAW